MKKIITLDAIAETLKAANKIPEYEALCDHITALSTLSKKKLTSYIDSICENSEKFSQSKTKQPIPTMPWTKHIAIINNRIVRIDTMKDITKQKTICIEGYEYNLRRVAFFMINNRMPSHNFLLPWE